VPWVLIGGMEGLGGEAEGVIESKGEGWVVLRASVTRELSAPPAPVGENAWGWDRYQSHKNLFAGEHKEKTAVRTSNAGADQEGGGKTPRSIRRDKRKQAGAGSRQGKTAGGSGGLEGMYDGGGTSERGEPGRGRKEKARENSGLLTKVTEY